MRQGDAVSALLDSMKARNALLDRVRPLLPEDLANHCLQAGLDNDDLVLATDTGAWAAALRFQGPALLRLLIGQGIQAKRCRVRVLPSAAAIGSGGAAVQAQASNTPHALRSSMGAHSILQAAECVSDVGLADSLRRLAKTLSAGGNAPG